MPTQLELDFDADVNDVDDRFSYLHDPCQWCKRQEASITMERRGVEFGICNDCARDDYYEWREQMLDR